MTVAAGVVGNLSVAAVLVLAARDMPPERCRAAALDRRHHLELAEADMAGIGLTPCRSMAAENIRDLPRRAGHGRGLLRPAQRADSIDTHRQTPILDEVDDTSILKTGTQPRYPRSPSWLICTGASPQPPLSRSDLVLWHYPEAFGGANEFRSLSCCGREMLARGS